MKCNQVFESPDRGNFKCPVFFFILQLNVFGHEAYHLYLRKGSKP